MFYCEPADVLAIGMNPLTSARLGVTTAALLLATGLIPAAAQSGPTIWDSVSTILRVPPAAAAGYHRFNFPRRDLTVRVGDVTVSPALALTGWAGFSGDPGASMVMGDLVVLPSELPGVVTGLLTRGFEVGAIHNHLAGEQPHILFVHFAGRGSVTLLARSLDSVLAGTAAPRSLTPATAPPLAIDTGRVFEGLGIRGRATGAVASVSTVLVPVVTMESDSLVRVMATASPVNIQMLDGGRAATSGDFAVTGDKVQPLLRALSAAHITPTAVHNHLVGEQPAITFIHFWGVGPLDAILKGLRAALDAAK
jgi:hypothetical protein